MRLAIESTSQLKTKRNLLIVGSLSLAAVLVWMAYSLYDIYTKDTVEPNVKKYLGPLNPSLDLETLASLQDRYQPPQDFTILVNDVDDQGNVLNFQITRANGSSPALPSATESASTNQSTFVTDQLNDASGSGTLP